MSRLGTCPVVEDTSGLDISMGRWSPSRLCVCARGRCLAVVDAATKAGSCGTVAPSNAFCSGGKNDAHSGQLLFVARRFCDCICFLAAMTFSVASLSSLLLRVPTNLEDFRTDPASLIMLSAGSMLLAGILSTASSVGFGELIVLLCNNFQ